MRDSGFGFLGNVLQSITARGLNIIGRVPKPDRSNPAVLAELLLSRRGEVSGVALSRMLLDAYLAAPRDVRLDFLLLLARRWGPDPEQVKAAIEDVQQLQNAETIGRLHTASEPRRQELLRRLNMAPGGTRDLIAMRQDVMTERRNHPDLATLDDDFVHLFSSWFNRGFLQLRAIEWTTPANILEKIIEYEAVHEISDWNALRARLQPEDRRCFGFFHPQLPDEPLIFVEVALTREISDRIETLLEPDRPVLAAETATTAIFYSISNCQPGLAGVSFGSLLIKQVVDELKHELPRLRSFATLSPAPGFAAWLATERASGADWITDGMRESLDLLDSAAWEVDKSTSERLRAPLLSAGAQYFLNAKDNKGRPLDQVARFHLGNGSRLEQLNFLGSVSEKGMTQSHGLMVNYLYALDEIEENHEAYAENHAIAASGAVRRLLPRTSTKD